MDLLKASLVLSYLAKNKLLLIFQIETLANFAFTKSRPKSMCLVQVVGAANFANFY